MRTGKLADFTKGWFIGDFEPALLKTKHFEIALKQFRNKDIEKSHVHRVATEYNLVTRGQVEINGKTFSYGELFTLEPGEPVNARMLTDEVDIICVKVPSIPGDKYPIKGD